MKDYTHHQEQFKAINSDVDFMKRLRISRLFTWMQDVAGIHVEKLGLGLEVLPVQHGMAWIIMRTRVEIERLPALYEPVTVETWPLRPRGLFNRDYTVKDADGNIIVRSISTWVLMDIRKRELKKTGIPEFDRLPFREERAIDGCKMLQLKAPGELSSVYERTIRYSDTDYNSHTNNTRYIDFALDCLDMDFHRDHTVRTVEINFVHEALHGDKLILYRADFGGRPEAPSLYVEGRNPVTDSTIFKTLIEFARNP